MGPNTLQHSMSQAPKVLVLRTHLGFHVPYWTTVLGASGACRVPIHGDRSKDEICFWGLNLTSISNHVRPTGPATTEPEQTLSAHEDRPLGAFNSSHMNAEARTAAAEEYNDLDSSVQVLLTAYQCASTGATLHPCCSNVILVEPGHNSSPAIQWETLWKQAEVNQNQRREITAVLCGCTELLSPHRSPAYKERNTRCILSTEHDSVQTIPEELTCTATTEGLQHHPSKPNRKNKKNKKLFTCDVFHPIHPLFAHARRPSCLLSSRLGAPGRATVFFGLQLQFSRNAIHGFALRSPDQVSELCEALEEVPETWTNKLNECEAPAEHSQSPSGRLRSGKTLQAILHNEHPEAKSEGLACPLTFQVFSHPTSTPTRSYEWEAQLVKIRLLTIRFDRKPYLGWGGLTQGSFPGVFYTRGVSSGTLMPRSSSGRWRSLAATSNFLDPNLDRQNTSTPLRAAVACEHHSTVQCLLDRGATFTRQAVFSTRKILRPIIHEQGSPRASRGLQYRAIGNKKKSMCTGQGPEYSALQSEVEACIDYDCADFCGFKVFFPAIPNRQGRPSMQDLKEKLLALNPEEKELLLSEFSVIMFILSLCCTVLTVSTGRTAIFPTKIYYIEKAIAPTRRSDREHDQKLDIFQQYETGQQPRIIDTPGILIDSVKSLGTGHRLPHLYHLSLMGSCNVLARERQAKDRINYTGQTASEIFSYRYFTDDSFYC
ncbi:uncharacterized protein BO97DRAFT_415457 [Aspergillus homomorphus CBS 101889]|uniref:Uncharacterized protein n=1 Tax=Aspergillus homomorphus (strain CBS 101889) TaxID=1450537 RepID=A0A395HU60_ASPHC|nr:hypothetical protein BO97DRAFT_415457 [Aspergillus homomorphus CBS 101889]RAL10953.1 hypothetical protein BO97DRAFT_415457 [Aspergillus homomorphus CBS 101889]